MSDAIHSLSTGVGLHVTITPRSGRDEIVGLVSGAIKIRIKAAPVDGKANEALLAFLARRLDVPPSSLSIASGATSRHKVVHVAGLTADIASRRLFAT
jgi:uncharacterized protein (TIGR00251 family)